MARQSLSPKLMGRIIPFALPGFSVGTDICRVSRIARLLGVTQAQQQTGRPGAWRFLRRVFHPLELEDPQGRLQRLIKNAGLVERPGDSDKTSNATAAPASSSGEVDGGVREESLEEATEEMDVSGRQLAEHVAGRFALKEAAIKACSPWSKLFLHDVVLAVRTNEKIATTRAPQIYVPGPDESWRELRCSLSHDGDNAIAVVTAVHPSGLHTTPSGTPSEKRISGRMPAKSDEE